MEDKDDLNPLSGLISLARFLKTENVGRPAALLPRPNRNRITNSYTPISC